MSKCSTPEELEHTPYHQISCHKFAKNEIHAVTPDIINTATQ